MQVLRKADKLHKWEGAGTVKVRCLEGNPFIPSEHTPLFLITAAQLVDF